MRLEGIRNFGNAGAKQIVVSAQVSRFGIGPFAFLFLLALGLRLLVSSAHGSVGAVSGAASSQVMVS
jgi:hypothetical protein